MRVGLCSAARNAPQAFYFAHASSIRIIRRTGVQYSFGGNVKRSRCGSFPRENCVAQILNISLQKLTNYAVPAGGALDVAAEIFSTRELTATTGFSPYI
jgi:hypothetical protein